MKDNIAAAAIGDKHDRIWRMMFLLDELLRISMPCYGFLFYIWSSFYISVLCLPISSAFLSLPTLVLCSIWLPIPKLREAEKNLC
jgi:hypothetical protein